MRSKRGDRAYFWTVVQLVGRSRIGHGRRSRRRHHESPGVARICSPARLLGSLKLIGPPRYTDARWRALFGRQNQGSLHGGEHKNESTAFPESLKGNSRLPAVLNHPCVLPRGGARSASLHQTVRGRRQRVWDRRSRVERSTVRRHATRDLSEIRSLVHDGRPACRLTLIESLQMEAAVARCAGNSVRSCGQ